MQKSPTFVIGVGMTKFSKAGAGADYHIMGKEAINKSLVDAGIDFSQVGAAVCGYNYGDAGSGQRAVYGSGLTGIPIFNTSNNCSTGSCALMLASTLVMSGRCSCALALGFESMRRGLDQPFTEAGWPSPLDAHWEYLYAAGAAPGPVGKSNAMTGNVIKMFGDAAAQHQTLYGTTDEQMALVAFKNHQHSVHNPNAVNQKTYSMEQILKAPKLYGPITLLEACPTGDGAAAAIVCNLEFVLRHNLQAIAVEIVSQQLVSDLPSSFDLQNKSFMNLCGAAMAKKGFDTVFASSGLTAADVDVLEVHDCFSFAEMMVCEAAGLCEPGKSGEMVQNGKWIKNKEGGEVYQYANRWVVNPSGGLESKGHPIGATGLGQCAELVWQLRGTAGKRQVDGAKVGLQHNFGLGSAAVVTLYRKYEQNKAKL